jgi:3-deoxy-D-manno-octulosonate cytidylyltransferase
LTEIVAAIPARWGSTRLPGKPLLELGGRPMVQHVYERAAAAPGISRVVVLTDDERIAAAVHGFGGSCELTPADCASGTDRIAWAARHWSAAAVVNVQGDEPLIEPQSIGAVAQHLRAQPADPIVTLAVAASEGDLGDPNAVKVVLDAAGYALYFSRAPIPFPRHGEGAAPLRHLGLYGYQRAALLALAALPPSPLERRESLEQLRALENGMRLRVLLVAAAAPGVDTAEDAARVGELLRSAR